MWQTIRKQQSGGSMNELLADPQDVFEAAPPSHFEYAHAPRPSPATPVRDGSQAGLRARQRVGRSPPRRGDELFGQRTGAQYSLQQQQARFHQGQDYSSSPPSPPPPPPDLVWSEVGGRGGGNVQGSQEALRARRRAERSPPPRREQPYGQRSGAQYDAQTRYHRPVHDENAAPMLPPQPVEGAGETAFGSQAALRARRQAARTPPPRGDFAYGCTSGVPWQPPPPPQSPPAWHQSMQPESLQYFQPGATSHATAAGDRGGDGPAFGSQAALQARHAAARRPACSGPAGGAGSGQARNRRDGDVWC